jgi:hypothetical protein
VVESHAVAIQDESAVALLQVLGQTLQVHEPEKEYHLVVTVWVDPKPQMRRGFPYRIVVAMQLQRNKGATMAM